MKIYHTSPTPIAQIKKTGTFGECLCFSSDVYSMSVGDVFVYSLEIDESEIIDACDFDADDAPEVLAHIQNVFECDEYQALDYLTGSEIHPDAEWDWFIQGQMGEAAKEAGYKAARGIDEQGSVYIVPMLGREKDLILET
ncbi:hypothetical protein COW36_06635 [bacterium (Candidatus Blackallbacteria) CG17_big_fil_post_rev_8_21_14_2_50_48_46]|uniref:Uncharacterized protein n=1 Tax=bacterium (Candidatus Blackallbacteria) CG17_big_fil_post_rev_8_21_14_2_50_48_46 TaxID=2014261 RepID=A0A2M7G897_9BACT|nr:MAG: hypothetical protein COW64_15215 [bacterium (Candidatus Blackallbacteria) CG18_big_fil_WC_8_21_14_2_50_49_26]PIW18014.1 MAG: hypothetical protein COW36_06635 [bacterium (Candidatus Blackallbacteria) CG17_big_fil_post_rev_8_21_14_2_50_48_46]